MPNEIVFIDHCEPPCGLGSTDFDCPACGARNVNYDELWWKHDEVAPMELIEIVCAKCRRDLVAWREDFDFFIETKEKHGLQSHTA